ncbi:Hypothetical predicted protein [Paramuricea clavata]|uniref:Uncharacterized protein n=1 Tax=Paramuricea clavata TaxID=317549 RepID=A0A6S7H3D2_PARCT|nr:Hypothetical predicted protein [Paramuricea clavata]
MMFAKILLKILMVSAWLSLAFGTSQGNEIKQSQEQIQSQWNMIKRREVQNQDTMNSNVMLHRATCSTILQNNASSKSEMYHINPQGISSSWFQVYCNMTSNNGTTVIGHDSESTTLVKGCENPGSYKRKIKYDIPLEQIFAIIKESSICEQYIKYECYHSRLLEKPFGWWVSRQGSQMNYWGGAAVNSGKCACAGMTDSCAGGKECNCDKNDGTWREDSGYLTDKNTLPVTELRFGDTGHPDVGEEGYHTLGKLRCWG